MSIQALSWVLDHSPASGNDRLVLIVLAHHANKDNPWAFVGYDTIAQETRASRATAIRSIARLVECGAIESRKSAGRNCNEYRVVTETEAPLPPTVPNRNGSLETVAVTVAPERRNSSSNSINYENGTLYRTKEPNDEPGEHARTAERFEKFWTAYPARDGKKLGKGRTRELFDKLDYEDQRAAWVGANNLADAILAGGKFGPPDPDRWLRDRKWEDWQEPANVPDPHEVTYSSAYSR